MRLNLQQRLYAVGALSALALWLVSHPAVIRGQSPLQVGPSIQSLTETGQGLTILGTSSETLLATFASSADRGILLSLSASATAEARAFEFVRAYGTAFGLTDASQVRMIGAPQQDALGLEHVRLQQMHRGIPVRAGELIVHLRGLRVMAANGRISARPPEDVVPAVAMVEALEEARQLVAKQMPDAAADAQYTDPSLEILDRALLSEPQSSGPRLAWFIEATGMFLREFIWIDAQSRVVLLHFSQLADAKSRRIYTANHSATLPGTLVRSEGGAASGDADQDNAYTFSGLTYDYYLANHSRDSFDNAGAALISTAHYCTTSTCPSYSNAFWNGTQMVYGDGYASADDVVAHELTHAVTERTAGLFYYLQSGALNESYSDIFGETVDLTDGVGNDSTSARWKMGEDLSIGAIRNMMTPNSFSDPAKMSDAAYFLCSKDAWTDDDADSGGVHINSGIPNHAYALMVDGGTYNGKTITAIGLTKAAKIEYRALTTYLTSGSGFLDNYNALNQSCSDLIGTAGISATDCTQVTNALQAVEMNSPWACTGATTAPAMCPTGTPASLLQEGFESGAGIWTATAGTGTWTRIVDSARTGIYSVYAADGTAAADHRLTMSASVTLPAGARFYFDHEYEFESGVAYNYDGGVVEYSTDAGSTWNDAGSLVDAGQTYNGTIPSTFSNPLGGRSAFGRSSYGYTATRLNLSSLAGQSVRFRFRLGTDSSFGSLGWLVDNVAIYTCASPPTSAPSITTHPSDQTVPAGANTTFTLAASGTPTPTFQWQVSTNSGSSWSDVSNAAPYSGATTVTLTLTSVPSSLGNARYRAVATNSAGSVTSNAATLTVTAAAIGPAITTHPASQAVTPGQTASFTVMASGNPTPTFQWQASSNGSTWTNLANVAPYSGATTSTLTVTGVTAGLNAAQYRAIATNSAGSATSNAATLTIRADASAQTKLAVGGAHACLVVGGALKCWGMNGDGQVGDGTTVDRVTQVSVVGLASGVTAVAAGFNHTCALAENGRVKCWGFNAFGRLGDGTQTDRSLPVDVSGLTGITAVAAGGYHSCAVTSAGGVKCWGLNAYGELGDGTTTTRFSPVSVTGLTSGAIAVTAGATHTCALMATGGVKCWGENSVGQLGDGTNILRTAPVDVWGLTAGVTAISAGTEHNCALMTSGGLKCWGANANGQLGDGTIFTRTPPIDVTGLTSGVVAVSAALNKSTCALTSAGGAKCWGQNFAGAVGDGTTTERYLPVNVAGLTSGVVAVSAGGCALTTSRALKCWGANEHGEVGDGTTITRLTPTDVIGFPVQLPRMNVDLPLNGAIHGPSFTVAGWAVDLGAVLDTGVDDVHVYAFPAVSGGFGAPVFLGHNYFVPRSDVGAVFGSSYTNAGFSLRASGLARGQYRIGAYAWSAALGTFVASAFVDVTVAGPLMSLDGPANSAIISQPFNTGGWAVDLAAESGVGIDAIHVWAFPVVSGIIGPGQFVDAALLGGSRPDVGAVFGSQFTNSGFNFLMTGLSPGQYFVGVYVRSTGSPTFNQQQFALVTIVR